MDHPDRPDRSRTDAGQTAAEYAGTLALVALLLIALSVTDAGRMLSTGVLSAVCRITGFACAAVTPGDDQVSAAGEPGPGQIDDGYDVEWPPADTAEPEARSGGGAFLDGLIAGEFDDTAPQSGGEAWWRAGGQFLSSVLVFGDVRDAGAAIGDIWSSGGRDGWGDLAWSGAGLVPIAGDAAKGLRLGDDAIDATSDAARAAEAARAADAARAATRTVDDIVRNGARLSQQRLEHIVLRHWPTSGAANAGKFATGTTVRGLQRMIDDAVRTGTHRANTRGRPGTIFEHDFGSPIGVDSLGNSTSRLRVVVDPGGNVVTAFPY